MQLAQRLLKEQIDGFADGLYHLVQIKFAYNSNRIEGSKLSEEQTRFLFETKSLVGSDNGAISLDDITETNNHFVLFNEMLYSLDQSLSAELIKSWHLLFKRGTSDEQKGYAVGNWKTMPNIVGLAETVPPAQVAAAVDKLLKNYLNLNEIGFASIVAFHHDFEAIHPFQDGNGRVGRMIAFRECLTHNIAPFVIDERHRQYYYRGLSEYKTEPGYLFDTCRAAQDQFIAWQNYFDGKSDTLAKTS